MGNHHSQVSGGGGDDDYHDPRDHNFGRMVGDFFHYASKGAEMGAKMGAKAIETFSKFAAGEAPRGVYGAAMQDVLGDGVHGGGNAGGFFGGAPGGDDPKHALKEYRESLAAATKDRIVRGLARALKRAGIEVDPDAPPEQIARALEAKLPNPRKNGQGFVEDAKTHETVCKTVADVLNDEFTPGARPENRLIDTSLGAAHICRAVAEMVHSMSTGVHAEFLEVHASLKRVLKNLEVLEQVMKQLHAQIMTQVGSADSFGKPGAEMKIQSYDEIYRKAEAERKRQYALLKNFVHVSLAPAEEELAVAMRDKGSASVIKKLKLVPGTSEFANSLAEAVSGLGTVAAVSARVDRALKEVGLGVEEYLKSGSLDAIEKMLEQKMKSSDFALADAGKFLEAVDTLRRNFYRRDELKLKVGEGVHGGDYHGGDDGAGSAGGVGSAASDGGPVHGGKRETKLDKRVKARLKERRLIVKEFIRKSTRFYDQLLRAIEAMGPSLGRDVPLSDQMAGLRNSLSRLSKVKIGETQFELALIGYYREASSRQKKEEFLTALRGVLKVVDDLMTMEMYRSASSDLGAIRAAIDGLIRTIDFYSAIVEKKYGGMDDGAVEGGGGLPEGLENIPEIARSGYDVTRSINTFLYFYYVAKVRENLKQTSKELEYYGEDYDDVLGEAVAAKLKVLNKEMAKVDKDDEDICKLFNKIKDPEKKAAARKFYRDKYKCKINFYRAIQALDLYMKEFTTQIVANPDDVKEIKSMLDGVEVIGRWFVEDTGDQLAAAFDSMPGNPTYYLDDDTGTYKEEFNNRAFRLITNPDGTMKNSSVVDHYYERLSEEATGRDSAGANLIGSGICPGIPQLPADPANGDKIKGHVTKVYDQFQALKNIMNAFIRVGDKFGGKEIRRKVFMSPTQIYRAFVDYLKCSALSQGVPAMDGEKVSLSDDNTSVAGISFGAPGTLGLTDIGGAPGAAYTTGFATWPVISGDSKDNVGNPVADGQTVKIPVDHKSQGILQSAGVWFGSCDSDWMAAGVNNVGAPTQNHPGHGVDPKGQYGRSFRGDFCVEDRYFTFCVKAMAAKVLTVLGVYDLFERPSPIYELTPTRMIIGGADDAPPKVIPEASELYFRLPRLVEFYKWLFKFTEKTGRQISMLPEMDGVFTGIIRLVFNKFTSSVGEENDGGDYSDREVRQLVEEINAIYEHFRGSGGNKAAMTSFVTEINRRYGVVTKKDYDLLESMLKEDYEAPSDQKSKPQTNYSILPGEEESFEGVRRAPSDRFDTWTDEKSKDVNLKGDYGIDGEGDKCDDADWKQWKMVKEFREKLDGLFKDVTPDAFTGQSFDTLINQAKLDMTRNTKAEKQLESAKRLIQGSQTLSGLEGTHALMFNETVVVGLNTLSAVYTQLTLFRQRIQDINLEAMHQTVMDELDVWKSLADFMSIEPNGAIDNGAADGDRRQLCHDDWNHDFICTILDRRKDRYGFSSDGGTISTQGNIMGLGGNYRVPTIGPSRFVPQDNQPLAGRGGADCFTESSQMPPGAKGGIQKLDVAVNTKWSNGRANLLNDFSRDDYDNLGGIQNQIDDAKANPGEQNSIWSSYANATDVDYNNANSPYHPNQRSKGPRYRDYWVWVTMCKRTACLRSILNNKWGNAADNKAHADDYISDGGANVQELLNGRLNAGVDMQTGLQSEVSLNNKKWQRFRIGGTDPVHPAPRELKKSIAHYCFDERAIMRELLSIIAQLTSSFQGLVEVRFPGTDSSQINVDFSNLASYVRRLISDIKYFMDILRPQIPESIIKRFEDVSNCGSYYWLQKHLLEEIIEGRPNSSSREPADSIITSKKRRSRTLDWMSRCMSKTFNILTEFNRFGLSWVNQRDAQAAYNAWFHINAQSLVTLGNLGGANGHYKEAAANVPSVANLRNYQTALGRALSSATGRGHGDVTRPKSVSITDEYYGMIVPTAEDYPRRMENIILASYILDIIRGQIPMVYDGANAVSVALNTIGGGGNNNASVDAGKARLRGILGMLQQATLGNGGLGVMGVDIGGLSGILKGTIDGNKTTVHQFVLTALVAGNIYNGLANAGYPIPAQLSRQAFLTGCQNALMNGRYGQGSREEGVQYNNKDRVAAIVRNTSDLQYGKAARCLLGCGSGPIDYEEFKPSDDSPNEIHAAPYNLTPGRMSLGSYLGGTFQEPGITCDMRAYNRGGFYAWRQLMRDDALTRPKTGTRGATRGDYRLGLDRTNMANQMVQPEGTENVTGDHQRIPSAPRVDEEYEKPKLPYPDPNNPDGGLNANAANIGFNGAAANPNAILAITKAAGKRYYNTINGDRGMSDYFTQYGSLFAELIFYNAAANMRDDNFPREVRIPTTINEGGVKSTYVKFIESGQDDAIARTLISTARPSVVAGSTYYPRPQYGYVAHTNVPVQPSSAPKGKLAEVDARLENWSPKGDGLTGDRSMVFKFNQVLSMYLAQFYDVATGKIYRNLIEGFANGAFSRAVMAKGNSMPDLIRTRFGALGVGAGDIPFQAAQVPALFPNVYPQNGAFGIRGDPTPNGVLQESLSLILQRMVNDVSPTTQISDHLVGTLSEIPLYIRESYRANLPGFIKLFELIQKEGEFLKKVIQNTRIGLGRPMSPYTSAKQLDARRTTAWPAQDSLFLTPKDHVKLVQSSHAVASGAIGAQDGITDATVNNVKLMYVRPENEQNLSVGSLTNSIHDLNNCRDDMESTRKHILDVIDATAAGCYALGNAAVEVLRELADEPLYMETGTNSIDEYKGRNQRLPLMPLSSSLILLKNLDEQEENKRFTHMLPDKAVGSANFKFLYGTRKLFGRPTSKFTLADAPGIKQNLEEYNSTATEKTKIATDRYQKFLTNEVTLLRYVTDLRWTVGALQRYGLSTVGENDGVPRNADLPALTGNLVWEGRSKNDIPRKYNKGWAAAIRKTDPENKRRGVPVTTGVYSINSTLAQVLQVTENNSQEDEIRQMVANLGVGSHGRLGNRSRKHEWVSNIVDMNIMPINVHALMRGIPFAPIYNYVYTFEQMACMMFGETCSKIKKLEMTKLPAYTNDVELYKKRVTSTRQMFLKLLMEPYAYVPAEYYGYPTSAFHGQGANGLMWRIFRGDDSLMMGRPKFLSDQIFNKVLFGTLVDTPYEFDEAGPAAAGRRASLASQRVNAPSNRPEFINSVSRPKNVNNALRGTISHTNDGASYNPRYLANMKTTVISSRIPANEFTVTNSRIDENTTGLAMNRFPMDIGGERRLRGRDLREGYGAITYIGDASNESADPMSVLRVVALGNNAPGRIAWLNRVGKMRFDTRIVRNLVFITNVQRLMRLKMNQELTQYRTVLVKGHSTVNPAVTEYGYMGARAGVVRGKDGPRRQTYYPGPYETAEGTSSRLYNSDQRFHRTEMD